MIISHIIESWAGCDWTRALEKQDRVSDQGVLVRWPLLLLLKQDPFELGKNHGINHDATTLWLKLV